jgi:hypothetical protein
MALPLTSWISFAATAVVAAVFWRTAWMHDWYTQGQIALLMLTLGTGAFAIWTTRGRWWVVPVVLVVLVSANLGLVQRAAMQAFWTFGGFAP